MYLRITAKNLPLVLLIFLGVAVTLVAWGPCFAPWNTACFTNGEWGDYKFHYQGWINYLHGPSWVPPYTYAFTWPEKSSVLFTDSIPIVAILAKPITRIFGIGDWQYFGLLSLVNSVIIAWSVSLVGLYRCWSLTPTIGLGIAFLTSSLSWSRLIVHHEALQLHGILILGLTWVITKQKNTAYWMILVSASLGIHAYYTPMIMACFLAHLLYTTHRVKKIILLICVVTISLYIYGFLPDSLSSGSEVWGANMLSILDPQNHSAIFSGLMKSEPYEIEGYSYLGLGIIAGCLIQISELKENSRSTSRLFPLAWWAIVILYYLFALGHTWNVGDTPVTPHKAIYAIPGISKLYDIFRSSGRFSWPLVYTISFWLFDKINGTPRAPLKVLLVVLLQLLDSNLRVIVRQGSLYSGALNKGTNPVTEWAEHNPAIAANIRSSDLIILGSVQKKSSLPPSYTPQYLSPASSSNWGGEGMTRLPSRIHTKDTDLQYWIHQLLSKHMSQSDFRSMIPVPNRVTIFTDNSAEIQQLQSLAAKLKLNMVELAPGSYSIHP